MKVVFIRVREINGLPDLGCDGGYQVHANIIPRVDSSTAVFQGRTRISSNFTWNFVYDNHEKSAISLILQRVAKNQEVGRVTLPLTWFPKNAVVVEEYPMIYPSSKEIVAHVTAEVHVSENGDCPFRAPKGKLLVKLAKRNDEKATAKSEKRKKSQKRAKMAKPSNEKIADSPIIKDEVMIVRDRQLSQQEEPVILKVEAREHSPSEETQKIENAGAITAVSEKKEHHQEHGVRLSPLENGKRQDVQKIETKVIIDEEKDIDAEDMHDKDEVDLTIPCGSHSALATEKGNQELVKEKLHGESTCIEHEMDAVPIISEENTSCSDEVISKGIFPPQQQPFPYPPYQYAPYPPYLPPSVQYPFPYNQVQYLPQGISVPIPQYPYPYPFQMQQYPYPPQGMGMYQPYPGGYIYPAPYRQHHQNAKLNKMTPK